MKNKKLIIGAMEISLLPGIWNWNNVYAGDLSNVSSSSSYKVKYLMENKIITGYPNGDLGLQRNITRAETLKIIITVGNYSEDAKKMQNQKSKFFDVNLNYWANGYINFTSQSESKGLNIIEGYGNNYFKPEGKIKYEEFAKMLIMSIKDTLDSEKIKGINDNWPKNCVNIANEICIFENVNYIRGKDISRIEAFNMLFNTLIYRNNKNTNKNDLS